MSEKDVINSVLITGATGFIGQQLVRTLESTGADLRIISRKQHPDMDTVVCDLAAASIPVAAVKNVHTVFHLAGYTHDLSDALKVESLYRAVNVDATIRLAKLAAENGVKSFVFVSSIKAGGSALPGQCVSEEDQGEPEGIYGQTKREAELALLEIGRQSGMHVSIIRPSLVYGIGVKGNLRMMLTGIDKGIFPPLPDTRNRRSMIHVDDLVSALLLVASDERANGEIFIATDGCSYSSREIYESMCSAVGKNIPSWRVPKWFFWIVAIMGDLLKRYIPFPFDSYRFKKLLGDECFSSNKIRTLLGFNSNHTLYDALPDMVSALRKERSNLIT